MLTRSEVAKLTDAQVLELAAGMGPAILGEALFERALKVQRVNPTGSFGPAIIGAAATALEEKDDEGLEDYDAEDPDEDLDDDDLEAREQREEEDLARMRGEDRAFDRELEKELKAEESVENVTVDPKGNASAPILTAGKKSKGAPKPKPKGKGK